MTIRYESARPNFSGRQPSEVFQDLREEFGSVLPRDTEGSDLSQDPQQQLTWQEYATQAGLFGELCRLLTGADREILDYLHRASCLGQGKSKQDKHGASRPGIPLIPKRLAKNGNYEASTYKKSIAKLRKCGLIVEMGKELGRTLSAPCWWLRVTTNPTGAIRRAYENLRDLHHTSASADTEGGE